MSYLSESDDTVHGWLRATTPRGEVGAGGAVQRFSSGKPDASCRHVSTSAAHQNFKLPRKLQDYPDSRRCHSKLDVLNQTLPDIFTE